MHVGVLQQKDIHKLIVQNKKRERKGVRQRDGTDEEEALRRWSVPSALLLLQPHLSVLIFVTMQLESDY